MVYVFKKYGLECIEISDIPNWDFGIYLEKGFIVVVRNTAGETIHFELVDTEVLVTTDETRELMPLEVALIKYKSVK